MMTTYEDNVMVNQINNLNNSKLINGSNDNKSVQQENKDKPNSSSEKDSISLSDTAKQLESLKSLIENAPEVDSEKVQMIKNELENGTLDINSDAIAKKILEDFGA